MIGYIAIGFILIMLLIIVWFAITWRPDEPLDHEELTKQWMMRHLSVHDQKEMKLYQKFLKRLDNEKVSHDDYKRQQEIYDEVYKDA